MSNAYIAAAKREFSYCKTLGDKTLAQVPENFLFENPNDGNSLAIIVKHLSGNMLSRWTDFLTADGEKPWRNRESEFENEWNSKKEVLDSWEKGWSCVFDTLQGLKEEQLSDVIYIRNMGLTVLEAIARQQSHYAYHVGQMVFLGKYFLGNKWQSLSIPKGGSKSYNQVRFEQEKSIKHKGDDADG